MPTLCWLSLLRKKVPAKNAGLLTGDWIVGVGEQAESGRGEFMLNCSKKLPLAGKDGVTLHIKRADEDKTLQLADTHKTGFKAMGD